MKIFRTIGYYSLPVFIIFLQVSLQSKVFANPTLNGITISPAIIQVTALPGQSTYSTEINVTDNTTTQIALAVSAENFTSSSYSTSINFITLGSIDVGVNQHGLAQSIIPGITQLALAPKQTATVPISIDNINNLEPGGHYAAIIFKSISTGTSSTANNIGINQVVTSLLFLTTAGGGTQSVQLSNPDLSSFYLTMPSTLSLVFTNTGNTQTSPRGVVIVKKGSQEVEKGIIGIGSSILLPGLSGIYTVNMVKEVPHYSTGKYSIQIEYNTPEQKTSSLYNKQYIYINLGYLLLLIGIILVILFALNQYVLKPRKRRLELKH